MVNVREIMFRLTPDEIRLLRYMDQNSLHWYPIIALRTSLGTTNIVNALVGLVDMRVLYYLRATESVALNPSGIRLCNDLADRGWPENPGC